MFFLAMYFNFVIVSKLLYDFYENDCFYIIFRFNVFIETIDSSNHYE